MGMPALASSSSSVCDFAITWLVMLFFMKSK